MVKWYALTFLVIGIGLIAPSRSAGEFGLPLYALAGWASLIIGVSWFGILVFIRL